MFYYISGTLALKTESFAVVEAGGIGYKLYASTQTLQRLGNTGDFVKLYTYTNFKSSADVFDIYGFYDMEELGLFELITSVSRVGAKTAVALLSNITPSKFALCVATNDFKYIADKTPGLGTKGAQRIVLELKDKFRDISLDEVSNDDVIDVYRSGNSDRDEAAGALVVLGYSPQEAKRAVANESGTVEEMIKAGLKNLMKG